MFCACQLFYFTVYVSRGNYLTPAGCFYMSSHGQTTLFVIPELMCVPTDSGALNQPCIIVLGSL